MNFYQTLYTNLKSKHGMPKNQWSLWCKRPKKKKEREEVIIEAILTQRTSWQNVKKAFGNLKKAKMTSLQNIWQQKKEKISSLIKPAGFYRTKADRLLAIAEFIIKQYGTVEKMKKENKNKLKKELLKIKGIGNETADSILLYGLDKPVFIIDEYTRRLLEGKNKKIANLSYSNLQQLFEKHLPKNFKLYQDFHALIVIDAKSKMNARK